MKEDIEIITLHGNAIGFVAPLDNEELTEYIQSNLGRTGVLSELQGKSEIGVLCELSVDEQYQNQGFGKELLNDFIITARRKGARVIILLLDSAQRQRKNFDLSLFYKSQGFIFMENTNWMIKNLIT